MAYNHRAIRNLYKKLLTFYPRAFREQFSESMEQTFHDLYREKRPEGRWSGHVVWIFIETTAGIAGEHMRLVLEGAFMKNISTNLRFTALVGSLLLALTFLIAPLIYLVGNWRDALGPFSYNVADFLYGPVWAASLVSLIFVLRERIGGQAPHRMSLALFASILAAGTMVLIACIRSANRQYHLGHPELHLENSQTILIVWTTLITGLTGAGWHFLGWAFMLIGSVGWTSRLLPRLLSILYLVAGIASWFVYLIPENEGLATLLGMIISVWQGILLWKARPEEISANRPDQP